jgi:hypothetical protein
LSWSVMEFSACHNMDVPKFVSRSDPCTLYLVLMQGACVVSVGALFCISSHLLYVYFSRKLTSFGI